MHKADFLLVVWATLHKQLRTLGKKNKSLWIQLRSCSCMSIRVEVTNINHYLSVSRSHTFFIYPWTFRTKQLVLTSPKISSIERCVFGPPEPNIFRILNMFRTNTCLQINNFKLRFYYKGRHLHFFGSCLLFMLTCVSVKFLDIIIIENVFKKA